MEQNSQINILESQIRESYARLVWTHKAHEKEADILTNKLNCVKLIQLVLSVVVTTGIVTVIFQDSKVLEISTAILSLVLTLLNTYLKKYDLGGMAQKHKDTALSLWYKREKYISLLTDIKAKTINLEQITERRDNLQYELYSLYKESPRTTSKAYKKATKALMEDEEMTLSEEEINKFLPEPLKQN
tara:strand:+ start:554 stop:1114 length:561 start_codon:yes stop_codon:yes gene_type:complete